MSKSRRSRPMIIGIILAVLTTIVGILSNTVELPSFIRGSVWFLLPILGVIGMLVMAIHVRQPSTPGERRTILSVVGPALATTLALGATIWFGREQSIRDSERIVQEQKKLVQEQEKLASLQNSKLKQLRIGFLPQGDRAGDKYDTRPLENYLADSLSVPVSAVYPGATYTDTVNALAGGKVEMGWLGPMSYLHAVQKYQVQVMLCRIAIDGSKQYHCYIIARPDAGIQNLHDLVGKPFVFVDPLSTSGNLLPRYELKLAGVEIDASKSKYALSHENALQEVLDGKYPAGAVSSNLYHEKLKYGHFHESDLVIVHKSRPIPSGPIVLRKDISRYDVLNIQDAFLKIEVLDKTIVNTIGIDGFAKVTDKSYDVVREMAKELGIDVATYRGG